MSKKTKKPKKQAAPWWAWVADIEKGGDLVLLIGPFKRRERAERVAHKVVSVDTTLGHFSGAIPAKGIGDAQAVFETTLRDEAQRRAAAIIADMYADALTAATNTAGGATNLKETP